MSDQNFQNTNPGNQFSQFNSGQQPTPNATTALVLGILSLVLCGIIGIILGIIGIVMANQGDKEYQANPGAYTESSYKNLKAGKTCSIIGICLGSLGIVIAIIYLLTVGIFLSSWH
jgi:hypothetical protein